MAERIIYRKHDGDTVTIVAANAVAGGEPVYLGSIPGIAVSTVDAGELLAVQLEGLFSATAASADTIALGDALYYDDTNKVVTTTDTGKPIGAAMSEKAAGVDGTVEFLLGA
jgi:predicted RecA/RadA family phage recombinase